MIRHESESNFPEIPHLKSTQNGVLNTRYRRFNRCTVYLRVLGQHSIRFRDNNYIFERERKWEQENDTNLLV